MTVLPRSTVTARKKNIPVTVVSNIYGINSISKSKCYTRAEYKEIEIDAPNMIKNCSTNIGGVDCMHENVSIRELVIAQKGAGC